MCQLSSYAIFMKKFGYIFILILLSSCSAILDKKKIDEDEELQEKIDSIDAPTIDSSLYASAMTAIEVGKYHRADQLFQQLIAKAPDNPVYQFEYARLLRKVGNCQPALEPLETLLEMETEDPKPIEISEEKALCLLSLGKFKPAGKIFTDIITKDSTRWKSINGAGLIFAIKKKFNEANQYFDLAAEVSGYNPAVLNNQGLTKAIMGNYNDALKVLREASMQAAQKSDQKRRIDLNLAMVYGISGDSEKARIAAKPHLTEPQLYNNLGVYAELAKNPDLAKTYLNKALSGAKIYYNRAWENLERVEKQ